MPAWAGAAHAAAAPAPVRTRRRPAATAAAPARQQPRRRAAPRVGVAGGVVWIVALALLLTGVVAMNVAVLRLNMTLDRLGSERANLRGDNAALASQLSSAAASPKIQTQASRQLGLVPAAVGDTTYVDLRRGR
jgi:hypothetical protein